MADDVRESNRQFAKSNGLFKTCCEQAGIPASKRQAAKFRDGRGKAIGFINEARKSMGMR